MTPTQSRVIAALLLALVLIAVLAAIVVPTVMLHRHYDNAIAKERRTMEVSKRLLAQQPQVETALNAVKQRNGRRFFLKNTAANLAGAELEDQVRSAIEKSGGRIATSQNIAPKDDGDFQKIAVNVQFFASVPNLQKVIYTLETQTPYIVVDSLTLRPVNANRDFKPAAGQEPEVNAQIEVMSWAYRGDKSSAEKSPDKSSGGAS
ncbi:MAG: type II secretion system protein GspM [Betaproteobacteria bacterium]|nr:type II secretion system protein GspM [Betaproteobacteria bacterium]